MSNRPLTTRPDTQITLDLLARHMWIAAQLTRAGDAVVGVQAAEEWDGDCLLTDVYEEYQAMARRAVYARAQEATS